MGNLIHLACILMKLYLSSYKFGTQPEALTHLRPENPQIGHINNAGYSAGICVLSSSLRYLEIVDDAHNFPFEAIKQPIFEGLGIFSYALLPHYDSDHPESAAIDQEIQKCIDNKWLFKALRDGEVLIENC